MKIAISGATSMIGSALANELLGQGHEVIAIVRNDCKKLSVLNKSDLLTIVKCDMCDYRTLDILIDGKVDVAVATAWNGTRGKDRSNQKLQKTNLQYNVDFLQAMIHLECNKFITAGTQAEYGLWTKQEKLTENVDPQPNTEYGKYKLAFYEYAKDYCQNHNCVLVEPRFFSLYGPNDYAGTLVISILRKMISNEPCDLTKCIQMWDFLYIDDAVKALCMLIESDNSEGVYNFGSGYSAPLKVFIEKMIAVTHSKSELHYGTVPYPATGIVNVNPDICRLKGIGWNAQWKFEDGIRTIMTTLQRPVS